MSSELIKALQDPARYDHPASGFQVLETHISWVILTGSHAYKIKKPMDFGFLDFSTLERRRHFCEEEVRLNRRLAPALYEDVVAITGSPEAPELNGAGEPFEYAIRMRQFDQANLLDAIQERGELSAEAMKDLARQTAAFHRDLPPVAEDKPLGTPEAVYAAMQENFDQIRPLLDDAGLLKQVDALEGWTRDTFERLKPLVAERRANGFVRECHGDLHLSNITYYEGEITVFDCIEFNEPFRWIDVINDLAFLLMDLESRGEHRLANDVLNTYLEYSGDFDGLPLLSLYKAYRAMVRAKIALFTLGNPDLDDAEKARLLDTYRSYAELADSYGACPNPYLLATAGLSGSGKTVISGGLARELDLIRLRSDVERKRLFGLDPLASSRSGIGQDMYSPEANQRTYDRLVELASRLLSAGLPVIVDAASLRVAERQRFAGLAEELGMPFLLVDCIAPEELRRKWVRERAADASEATEALLEEQKKWVEQLTEEERSHTVYVHTEEDRVAEGLADRIRAHFGQPL
ncbi:bifunctional aminoglycoside phosphotransferase/ATP-binding protein [Marinobacter bohaiensis]|uniref:bifunctional aminoglycoside phosphotransferase/ATP-binding protein n=1 Tax=Marinobacter bohaiensis TaxID=2201898 RepID=UPI000DACD969|nr:bifunctional aminoglycoside phosphotransferase/ATP-binding protein [Marinobacter bohaiensis]